MKSKIKLRKLLRWRKSDQGKAQELLINQISQISQRNLKNQRNLLEAKNKWKRLVIRSKKLQNLKELDLQYKKLIEKARWPSSKTLK